MAADRQPDRTAFAPPMTQCWLQAGLLAELPFSRRTGVKRRSPAHVRSRLRVYRARRETLHHVYRKWQGHSWTLTVSGHDRLPPGDEALRPLVRRVYDWLFSKHFLESPLTAIYAGQEDRVRHCASMDGNAIWYSVRLGLEDERTRPAVDRLIDWQWPDGGWNCDKRVAANRVVLPGDAYPGAWSVGVRAVSRLPTRHGRRTQSSRARAVATAVVAPARWHA